MNFTICSKWGTTVEPRIKTMSSQDFTRAPDARNAIFDGKGIEPHHHKMHQFNDHYFWDRCKRKEAKRSARAFFYNSNTMLNF
jgi:hypothetical protein